MTDRKLLRAIVARGVNKRVNFIAYTSLLFVEANPHKTVLQAVEILGSEPAAVGHTIVDRASVRRECRESLKFRGVGEQHYLPVLSDEELVTNTLPFTLHEQGTTTLKLNQLFAADGRNKKLTISPLG